MSRSHRSQRGTVLGAARGRVLRQVERLESRRLLAVAPVAEASDDDDARSLSGCPICGSGGCCRHTDAGGRVFMSCAIPAPGAIAPGTGAMAAVAQAPLADTFLLHSRPTATKKIYLDFDGHVTTDTPWQGGASFTTPAFSLDSNFSAFSDDEKRAIQEVWARTVEDFVMFDVDVTTEEPSVDDLRNTGGSDTRWGIRVVIGGTGSWMSGAAGVAYLDSFTWDSDTPCFVFAGQSWKTNLTFMTTCISHEVGHTLGLAHDGYNGSAYYGGRGSGATSWGPIMGNPSRSLTQWSNGDYGGSTNKEDDLAVMVKSNGFGYRPDDHGDTAGTATMVPGSEFAVSGVIGSRTDVDMFGFTAAAGTLSITVKPIAAGANLDVLARLIDAAGVIVATSNPIGAIDASFNLAVAAGQYFISVDGTGEGNPSTTGYSDYGSLGQYTVTVGKPTDPLPTLAVADVSVVEGNSGTTTTTLTFTLSAAAATAVSVQYATANGTATTVDNDYTSGTGTVTFAAGETRKTVSLSVRGDTKVEPDETFSVNLTNAVGAILARPSAVVTITNDDNSNPPGPLPTLSVADVKVAEGNSGTTSVALTFALSAASASTVTVRYATANGTATTADNDYTAASGTITFAAGETSKTLTLSVSGDTKVESDETFVVNLTSPVGATLARPSATVTIADDDAPTPPDPLPTLSVADVSVAEGSSGVSYANFVITLSAAATQPVLVRYTTSDRTATTFDRDYAAAAGSVSFAAGETSKTVAVAVMGDTRTEADETFAFVISSPVGATITRATAIGTITNDDTAASTTLSIADAQKTEGNGGVSLMSFVVSLSSPANDPITVKFRTVAGTATAGSDYAAATGTIRFARGGIRQAVNVWIQGDRVVETNETFTVELFDATGATISRDAATGTILNDDGSGIRAAAFAQLAQESTPTSPKRPSVRL